MFSLSTKCVLAIRHAKIISNLNFEEDRLPKELKEKLEIKLSTDWDRCFHHLDTMNNIDEIFRFRIKDGKLILSEEQYDLDDHKIKITHYTSLSSDDCYKLVYYEHLQNHIAHYISYRLNDRFVTLYFPHLHYLYIAKVSPYIDYLVPVESYKSNPYVDTFYKRKPKYTT